jgi:hypothetical protein
MMREELQGSFSSIEVVVRRRGFGYPWKSSANQLTSADPKRLSLALQMLTTILDCLREAGVMSAAA